MTLQIVLITGCSDGGIGSKLASHFSNNKTINYVVYATGRSVTKLSELKSTNCKLLELDVTSETSRQSCISQILKEQGKIDILVNNAGLSLAGPIVELEGSDIKNLLETNLFGIIELIKLVSKAMIPRKSGCIVNVGSIVGDLYTPYTGMYSVSKSALHTLSNVLRLELAPFHIKVLTVKPGSVKSNIASNNLFSTLIEDSVYKKVEAEVIDRIHYSQLYGTLSTETFAARVVRFVQNYTNPSPSLLLWSLLCSPIKLLFFLLVAPLNFLFKPKVLTYFRTTNWWLNSELVLGGNIYFYLIRYIPSFLTEALLFRNFRLDKLVE